MSAIIAVETTGSLQAQWAKVDQASLVLCLDAEKMVVDTAISASSDSNLEVHYTIARSPLSLDK